MLGAGDREGVFGDRFDKAKALLKPLCAILVVQAERGILDASIAGGKPQQQSALQQMIGRSGLLGDDERISERQHDASGAQRDAPRMGGEIAQINHGVQHLSGVAKIRVIERHVAHPKRGEPGLVRDSGHACMVFKSRKRRIRITLQRHDEAEGELSGFKDTGIGGVRLQFWRQGAN